MTTPRRVTIVGGGLAGLTLGIRLRRLGVACDVWEAQEYPRHRVCGEFLSGRGRGLLADLGLMPVLEAHGARLAREVAFHSGESPTGRGTLPEPALCLSRHRMDAVLADAFTGAGGVLRRGERFVGALDEPGVVRATGREPQVESRGWRWLGLKAHATGVVLTADLEMHFLGDAYVGLCGIEDGRVNVCGLFRTRVPLVDLRRTWRERLRGPGGSPLRERLEGAVFDEASFTAVAALRPVGRKGRSTDEFRVGDARGMIPPVTGNGMSMALESAALAAPHLASWSRGEAAWDEARRSVDRTCDAAFRGRLKWAAALQSAVMNPVTRRLWAFAFPRFPGLWRVAYFRTR